MHRQHRLGSEGLHKLNRAYRKFARLYAAHHQRADGFAGANQRNEQACAITRLHDYVVDHGWRLVLQVGDLVGLTLLGSLADGVGEGGVMVPDRRDQFLAHTVGRTQLEFVFRFFEYVDCAGLRAGKLGCFGDDRGEHGFKIKRGGHRPGDLAKRSQFADRSGKLGDGARGCFLLLGFEFFQSHEVVAKGASRPRRIAYLIAAAGIRNIQPSRTVRQLQQNPGDLSDRPADRKNAENCRTHENDNDKQSRADADLPGLRQLRLRRDHAFRGQLPGIGCYPLDQAVDLGPDLVDPIKRLGDVAVVLFKRRHLGGVGGVVFRQRDETYQPLAIFGVAARLYRGLDMSDAIAHAFAQSGERLISFPLGNRQAYFTCADLHPLQSDAGAQQIGNDELFVSGQLGLPRD